MKINNTINFNTSISGNYTVSVIKKNGEEHFPFGKKPLNNLILDTFFDSILRDGYRLLPQMFIQSCRVGGGVGSDTPASKEQTGLQGSEVYISHIGDTFTATVDSGSSSIIVQRDFKFDVNNSITPITCREATIGCFGAYFNGSFQPTADITTSRFVFPSDVIINQGEQLKLNYRLSIRLEYISNNVNVNLNSNDLNLNGIIRIASNDVGLISIDPSSGTTVTPGNGYVPSYPQAYLFRNWKTTNSATFTYNTTNLGSYGAYSNIFGLWSGYNKIGFFDTAHANSIVTYPTARQTYTNLGPLGIFASSNYTVSENGATIDMDYYFPAHTLDRTCGGIYLWYNDYSFSYSAIYLKFTENDFSTNRSLLIPAGQPVGFKIRWIFSR